MFGIQFGAKKTDTKKGDASLATDPAELPDFSPETTLSGKSVEENQQAMEDLQKHVHNLRVETSALLHEEHPETIRHDTVAHEHETMSETEDARV